MTYMYEVCKIHGKFEFEPSGKDRLESCKCTTPTFFCFHLAVGRGEIFDAITIYAEVGKGLLLKVLGRGQG